MSVSVQQLTKIYGEQHAVHEVSFEAHSGQVLGFLGPNGAGKSTTMKIITGFLPPSSGTASVCGYNVETAPMEARRRIGYLPENNPLYKEMYVREYLHFTGKLHKVPRLKQRVEEMIEATGLGRECHKLIGALSKGYRQRVGLAQAMLHDPEVLILDEPTSGLDPNQLVEIRALIRQLGQQKTVIFSTHIMQEVQAVCDRVIIINRGKIVADDPIERLQERIAGESVLTIEFRQAVKKEALLAIPGVKQAKNTGGNRWQLSAAADADVRPQVADFVKRHELDIIEMHREAISVEEVFKKLTSHA
ncbi:MAG TPA: gliding motility-associated ABC transporter ATP-binding subunit GldA [Saprospiraceae bacterium]|nr:gliding motility-associated ABC transporter ATP-binding subunit GldA [Saprospiraceae bacterium]HRK82432.1 gliding motility-associated ABC transporter ATP-binding subunit GldA [Saprospiraceae bacterium]